MPEESNRPYRDLSEAEILEEIRNLRQIHRDMDWERNRLLRKPGYQTAAEEKLAEMQDVSSRSREYQNELDIRRRERRKQPEAQPEQQDTTGPRIEAAISRWANDVTRNLIGSNSIDSLKTESVVLTWYVSGRKYKGFFNLTNSILDVWIMVRPGTAGSVRIGRESYLPANIPSQVNEALNKEARHG